MDIENSASIVCEMDNQKYQIEIGDNHYFHCDNCSNKMKTDLKEITDFNNLDEALSKIENYFNRNHGTCE